MPSTPTRRHAVLRLREHVVAVWQGQGLVCDEGCILSYSDEGDRNAVVGDFLERQAAILRDTGEFDPCVVLAVLASVEPDREEPGKYLYRIERVDTIFCIKLRESLGGPG